MHILYVDDDDVTREVISSALENCGFRVDVAIDGSEGLAMATAHQYDALVVDYQMPGLNGVELLRKLTKEGRIKRERAVMVTGGNVPAEALLHARDVLQKPFHSRELIGVLEDIRRSS